MTRIAARAGAWMLVVVVAIGATLAVLGRPTDAHGPRHFGQDLLELGLYRDLEALRAAAPADRAAAAAALDQALGPRVALVDATVPPDAYVDRGLTWWWTPDHALRVDLGDGQVAQIGPLEGPEPPHTRVVPAALLVAAFVALGAIGFTWPLAKRTAAVERASRAVAAGDLSVRVDDPVRDPIGDLARQFDHMTAEIGRRNEQRDGLFQAVAHELGTPLTRMGLSLELLDRGDDPRVARRVVDLRTDLDELTALTDELLAWVRVDGSPGASEAVPLDALVDELVARARALYPDVAFDVQVPPGTDAWGDPRSLRRAIDNLVRNAGRYARATVSIAAARAAAGAMVLKVSDDGPGVAEADRTRIFEPFARASASRDRATGGVGLGLTIVSRAAARHGGAVTVDADPALGGARFTLTLPGRPA